MNNLFLHFKSVLTRKGWKENISFEIDRKTGVILAEHQNHALFFKETQHDIGLPGINNVHSHAFQRGFAGSSYKPSENAHHDSFWTWRKIMYKFLNQLNPDHMEAIAAMAYMEMLETGFTGVAEFHYVHHAPNGCFYDDHAEMSESLMQAAEHTGIYLCLLPVYYRQGGFNGAPPEQHQARFIHDVDSFLNLQKAIADKEKKFSRVQSGLALHSLRAVKQADLEELVQKQSNHHPIHIHISEQMAEVRACLEAMGQRPVEWLFNHIDLDYRWCLIHATHLNNHEINLLSNSDVIVGLCPITEADLGDGIFPAKAFLERSGIFGIGSDSNCRINALEELRLLEYGQRLFHQHRNLLVLERKSVGRTLYETSIKGGNQAVYRNFNFETSKQQEIGLGVGAQADIISLNASHPDLVGKQEDLLIDSWIFCAGKACIDRVWVDGEEYIQQGKHLNRAEITERYHRTMIDLLEKI